jgi:hypothetical protein
LKELRYPSITEGEMDPITMVVAALEAGALVGRKDTASSGVKNAYAVLRDLLKRRLAGKTAAELVLARHEAAPEMWGASLEATLAEYGVGSDLAVIEAAQALLALLDQAGLKAGKYAVDLGGAQGVQVGDHGRQVNYFNPPDAAGAKSAVDRDPSELHTQSTADTGYGRSILVGDYGVQNTYLYPPTHVSWPLRVGVVPLLADCYQDRAAAKDLETLLEAGQTAVLTQVLSGLGGIGKTQIAAHYASMVWGARAVDLLVWLTVSSRQAVITGYREAVHKVDARDPGEDPEAAARRFLAWLAATDRSWLVVLDDLADPADLRGLWPQGASGRTVATTRRRDNVLYGTGRRVVEIGVFTPEEALAYLTAKLDNDPDCLEQSAELAEDLGYLPLALAQAATYIRDRSLTCAEYRVRFASQQSTLAESLPPDALSDDYPHAVAVTWSLSIDRGNQLPPKGLAGPALQLAAMLDPNGIPEAFFHARAVRAYLAAYRAHLAFLPDSESIQNNAEIGNALEVSTEDAIDALHCLRRLSLAVVDRKSPFQETRVHALVQRVVREHLTPDASHVTAVAAADALFEVWPEHDSEASLSRALRDCTDSLRRNREMDLWSPAPHPVIFRCGHSLGNVGLVGQAVTYWENLAASSTQRLGPDHPVTLEARGNFASWSGSAGDAPGAVHALDQVLADCQRLLGLDHPLTMDTRVNLARWRGEAMDPAGARTLEELLAEQLRLFGHDDPRTLKTRHQLARGCGYDGDAARSIQMFEDLIPDCQRVLGLDHPEVLNIRADLAFRRGMTGDAPGAIRAFEELIRDRGRINGPDHPLTLNNRGNLARWRGEAGDPAGAVRAFTELLTDSVRILGPEHQHVLNTRSDLAHYRGMAGDPAGAVRALKGLIPHYLRVLGPDRWETFTNRERLAHWRGMAGDTAGAAEAYSELLTDRLRVLGPDHVDTVSCRSHLAHWRAQTEKP